MNTTVRLHILIMVEVNALHTAQHSSKLNWTRTTASLFLVIIVDAKRTATTSRAIIGNRQSFFFHFSSESSAPTKLKCFHSNTTVYVQHVRSVLSVTTCSSFPFALRQYIRHALLRLRGKCMDEQGAAKDTQLPVCESEWAFFLFRMMHLSRD